MLYPIRFFMILVMLLLVACGNAENTNTNTSNTNTSPDHPLLDMLKYVPIDYADGGLSYLDFRAVEDALPYVERPSVGEITYLNWMGYTYRWYEIPNNLRDRLFPMTSQSVATVGIEFREINRTLYFGQPPQDGVVWSGDFDLDAIRTAHTAREYQMTTINDIETWCYEGDCSIGAITNVQNVENGNLFDRGLGRKVPFLIWDSLLISTPQQTLLEAIVNRTQSLYDHPDIRALAHAATAPDGLLVNWQVFKLEHVALTTIPPLNPRDTAPMDISQAGSYTYQSLPPYRAMAIADRQEGDKMVFLLMVVYEDEATAQAGATELVARVADFSDYLWSPNNPTPVWDVHFTERNMTYAISHSTFNDGERVVAIVRIEYDTPTQEQAFAPMTTTDNNSYLPDARAYRVVYESIIRRTFYPLWIVWND